MSANFWAPVIVALITGPVMWLLIRFDRRNSLQHASAMGVHKVNQELLHGLTRDLQEVKMDVQDVKEDVRDVKHDVRDLRVRLSDVEHEVEVHIEQDRATPPQVP
jgi:predicted  nucleic acid-binding Zn-ribbon protein